MIFLENDGVSLLAGHAGFKQVKPQPVATSSNHGRHVFLAANRARRSRYFSPGTHYVTDRAIESHLYDRVRSFLVRRHKMPARSIGPFSKDAVFGDLGVPRLRHLRRSGAMS